MEYDNADGSWQSENASGIAMAAAYAWLADVIVVCVGENSYCETPGNMDDLNLSQNQKELVRRVAATGKPVILVLNEGRPRIIGDIEPLAKAVIDIMLPSNYGGDALAALLAGDENFSGKLPFTYPKHINALHTYDYKVSEHREVMDGSYNYDAVMDVQWPFGFGLSYTTFEYGDFKLESPTAPARRPSCCTAPTSWRPSFRTSSASAASKRSPWNRARARPSPSRSLPMNSPSWALTASGAWRRATSASPAVAWA